MIGVILLFLMLGGTTYAMYSMYTGIGASNLAGLSLGGVLGAIGTWFVDGITHISAVVENCLHMTASYGEYMVVIGMVVFTFSVIYNGITTQGRDFSQ